MKRFTMMLAAALLLVGAAFGSAKASTINLLDAPATTDDATFFSVITPGGGQQIAFKLGQNASSVTINLLGLFVSGVDMNITGESPSQPPSHAPGFPSLISTAEFTYANLVAGTTYFINLSGTGVLFGFGLVLGSIHAVAATPIPASLLMFLTALGGLGLFAKRRKLASAMGAAA